MLSAAQRELDEFTEECARTKKKMVDQICSSLDMLMDHKNMVEKQLAGLKEYCAEKAENMRPLLTDDPVDLE